MNNSKKIILDLCGGTGAWSRPYQDNGYDVRVITLPEHDVRTYSPPDHVYGILVAPPCTMFSFARTNAKDKRDLVSGIDIVYYCLKIVWSFQTNLAVDTQKKPPLAFWVLENPKGMLEWFLGKPSYTFQPWEFGDMYKKKTCLWGWFKEPIKTNTIEPDVPKFDKLKTREIHGECYGEYNRTVRRAITPQRFAQAFYERNK